MTISFKEFLQLLESDTGGYNPRQSHASQAADAHVAHALNHGITDMHKLSSISYLAWKAKKDEQEAKEKNKKHLSPEHLANMRHAAAQRKEAKQKEMRSAIIALAARKAALKKKK